MSRIRIVKGTITKTTGGDHNIFSNGNIVTTSSKRISEEGLQGISYGDPLPIPENPITKDNFDITFELDKDTKNVVPFGILDFKNNIENPFFSFKYILSKAPIDSLDFQILNENDEVIYQMKHLKTVIVPASKKPEILFKAKKPAKGPLISKTWDFDKIYNEYNLVEPADYTKQGEYFIHWDGFDNNDIYDSTRFNNKNLKAKITAVKGSKQKSITVDFSTRYCEVEWTDVKIDKKTKRIDLTLRVNLTDGGENGLTCQTINSNIYGTPARNVCDWDKIPASEISSSQPIIKMRTKSYEELKKTAFAGLEKYWGRNNNNTIGNNVTIIDIYEVFIKPVDTFDNALNTLPLIYNTNGDWMRSGNPGGSYKDGNLDDDLLDSLPDFGVIQRLSYNVGYIKHDWENDSHNGWRYHTESDINTAFDAISSFKETAAHELGHELLQAYAGTAFSWQHKGTSYYLPQDTKSTKGNETKWDKISHVDEMPKSEGENYPKAPNEIDLMKYYNNEPNPKDISRLVAAEKDVISLIWLTQIEIK